MVILLTLLAAATGYTADYERCMAGGDAAAGVTVAMMNCLGDEIARQDDALNRVYAARMTALAKPRAAALRASEREWIRARDARCRKAARPDGGGSLGGLTFSNCILDETIARTRFVAQFR